MMNILHVNHIKNPDNHLSETEERDSKSGLRLLHRVFSPMVLNRVLILSGLAWAVISFSTMAQGIQEKAGIPYEIAPLEAPFRMPDLQRHRFPDREFDIRDFGAVAGGETSVTNAIAGAITACHRAGGGKVVIPEGEWLTGAIHLKSNINLHIVEGATVYFTENLEEYLPTVLVRHAGVEAYNYSPLIYAQGVKNIAITGRGVFDGNWEFWRDWAIEAQGEVHHRNRIEEAAKPLEERNFGKGAGREGMRPHFVELWNADNVLIEGPTFRNGPMWNIHLVYSQNIIVRDISVLSLPTHNGDGIVVDSSSDVLIEYVHLETSDDAVVIKSGLNEDGRLIDIPTRRVVVRNFTARYVRTGSGGIVFGSETSGGIHDIYVHDAYFEGSDRGIRFKSGPGRGSYVTDIFIHDITLKNVSNEVMNFHLDYGGAEHQKSAQPRFRNIFISNIDADGANEAINGAGMQGQPIRNVRIENSTFRNMNHGATFKEIDGLYLNNIEIHTSGTPLKFVDVYNVEMNGISLSGEQPHLIIDGNSKKIKRDGTLLTIPD